MDPVRPRDAAPARPGGDRRPRPPRSRLRGGRGRRPGRARRGVAHLRRRDDAARRATSRAGWSPWRGGGSSTAYGPGRRGSGARSPSTPSRAPGPTEAADDTLRVFFLCAHPALTPGVGGRADAAGGRGPDHAPGRRGLPGARGDDGAADQPREADGLGRVVRPAGRPRHGAARALPRLQRGLLRRRGPRRRGDPADPAARVAARQPRRPTACSP